MFTLASELIVKLIFGHQKPSLGHVVSTMPENAAD